MADNNEAEKPNMNAIAHDGRGPVAFTPLREGRGPVSMIIQPNDINSGRMPASVTPLTPGQPSAPVQPAPEVPKSK